MYLNSELDESFFSLNKTCEEFIRRINIDAITTNVDCNIYSKKDIDRIVDEYGVYTESDFSQISIANILGYNFTFLNVNPNIIYSLPSFFDENGDGYHSRSVGLLKYSSDDIIENLSSSFEQEPMIVDEIKNNIYIINGNGLHRYTVLRILYLSEVSKTKDPDELKRIAQKYTIPVQLRKLDKIKTYSMFLLTEIFNDDIKKLELEYDQNYRYTGNTIVVDCDGKKTSLNDEKLIAFIRKKIELFKEKYPSRIFFNFQYLKKQCDKNVDLRDFINKYFSDVLDLNEVGIEI